MSELTDFLCIVLHEYEEGQDGYIVRSNVQLAPEEMGEHDEDIDTLVAAALGIEFNEYDDILTYAPLRNLPKGTNYELIPFVRVP